VAQYVSGAFGRTAAGGVPAVPSGFPSDGKLPDNREIH